MPLRQRLNEVARVGPLTRNAVLALSNRCKFQNDTESMEIKFCLAEVHLGQISAAHGKTWTNLNSAIGWQCIIYA